MQLDQEKIFHTKPKQKKKQIKTKRASKNKETKKNVCQKKTNVHKQELTSPDCGRNWNKNHIVWIICKIFKISLHEDFILGVRLFRLYDTLLTP